MNDIERKDLCEAIRRGLMDSIILGDFNLEDSVGVSEMVEKMPEDYFDNVFEAFLQMDQIDTRKCLDTLYSQHLIENNSAGVAIGRANIWASNRNDVLLSEADTEKSEQDKFNDALVKVAMTASAPVVIKFIFDSHQKNPEMTKKGIRHLKAVSIVSYRKISSSPIIRQILPSTRVVKKSMNATQAGISKAANKVDNIMSNIRQGRYTGPTLKFLAVIGGVTAVATAAHLVYQRLFSKAAKSCKGQKGKAKTACILKVKINAAGEAIKSLEMMINGCEDKSDPRKCKHAIQSKIWYWNKRKQKYQDKLSKIGQGERKVFRSHRKLRG